MHLQLFLKPREISPYDIEQRRKALRVDSLSPQPQHHPTSDKQIKLSVSIPDSEAAMASLDWEPLGVRRLGLIGVAVSASVNSTSLPSNDDPGTYPKR